MKNIVVYDPAMCCSTGICGAEVDQTLVTFAADLDWLKSEGVSVTRINLSQEPAAFAANAAVNTVLQEAGVDGLPVILIDGKMRSSARYPTRAELADMTGAPLTAAAATPESQTQSSGCCGGSKTEQTQSPGCCGGAKTEQTASGCC